MIPLWERNLFHLIFLGFIAYFLVESFSYTKSEFAMLPLMVGIPTFIILVFNLLGENIPKITKLFESSMDKMLNVKGSDVQNSMFRLDEEVIIDNRQLLYFCLWLLGLGIAIYYFGFLIAAPVISFIYGIAIVRYTIWRSILVAVIPALVVFAASLLLKSTIFEGLIYGAWVPAL